MPLSRIFYLLRSPSNPAVRRLAHDHRRQRTHRPREPASLPELRAADQGVADALESVLSDNTQRVYGTQWRIFTGWCDEVALTSLPAEPLTVARYLAARAGSGASIATIRLATSAICESAHEWAEATNHPAGTRACAPR